MPRPRFHKLPPLQQQAILRAAFDEFATHGFHSASLNRIIDAAGTSKGSMYYYFDDKEELYAHVARGELGRMFEAAGPFPVPAARNADAFWAALEDYYRRIMTAFAPRSGLQLFLRNSILKLFNVPFVARLAMGNSLRDAIELPAPTAPA